MGLLDNTMELMSLTSVLFLQLLNVQHSALVSLESSSDEEWFSDGLSEVLTDAALAMDMSVVTDAALHHRRLGSTVLSSLDEDLRLWVKPRSTTWFSRFVLEEPDDERWVEKFRMTKRSVLSLADLLKPSIQKKDTNDRSAIPVLVKLACTLYKLSHGASLHVCSEMFAVGRSTVSCMLRDVVHAINNALRSEISWPAGERLQATAASFQQLFGLPGVVGVIGETHFAISRPKVGASDYYHFTVQTQSRGYSMNCQAVFDSSKRFLDLYVGMPGSIDTAHVLESSSLYSKGQNFTLWDPATTFNGVSPYLLGGPGYPSLPWLKVPHKQQRESSMVDALSGGHRIVQNAFALLKQTFRELHGKSDFSLTLLPDVVVCCALLHNQLQKQSQQDVDTLLDVLRTEMAAQDLQTEEAAPDGDGDRPDSTSRKRRRLSLVGAV